MNAITDAFLIIFKKYYTHSVVVEK